MVTRQPNFGGGGGAETLEFLAAYLRSVCVECFDAIAMASEIEPNVLREFAFDYHPVSLTMVGKMFLAIHVLTGQQDRLHGKRRTLQERDD